MPAGQKVVNRKVTLIFFWAILGQLFLESGSMIPAKIWGAIQAHSVTKVAKDLGISRKSVYQWRELPDGIPPHRALELEALLEVPRSEIRPDLWG
jgi:transposase-like protein